MKKTGGESDSDPVELSNFEKSVGIMSGLAGTSLLWFRWFSRVHSMGEVDMWSILFAVALVLAAVGLTRLGIDHLRNRKSQYRAQTRAEEQVLKADPLWDRDQDL